MLEGPFRVFSTALRTSYKPDRPYPGAVQLVLADDGRLDHSTNQREHRQVLLDWRQVAPNITYTYAQGNHMTMLEQPNVGHLVKQLELS